MTKVVEFRHGFLSPSYEEQANEQGYTLGEEAERFQKWGKYVLDGQGIAKASKEIC